MTLRIVGIAASPRPGSASSLALDVVLGRTQIHGCQTELIRLADLRLPFCNGDKQEPWPGFPAVARLRASITRAHGVVLATPEYHGGMSGALKNALDLLDFPHAEGKVFAAISALGGCANSNALNQIRTSVRWLHGWMLPDQVAVPNARRAHASGVFHDPELVARLTRLSDSLVWATRALLPDSQSGGDRHDREIRCRPGQPHRPGAAPGPARLGRAGVLRRP